MRFGVNSRKGASSLIVVMFVAVIALAGTAVYVALDRTVLTEDGYALPGSTYTYSIEINNTHVMSTSYEIVGYSDGQYYEKNIAGLSGSSDTIIAHEFTIKDIPEGTNSESVTVNVPGLGNTSGTRYTALEDGIEFSVTIILHGLAYSVDLGYGVVKMTDADIVVGNYGSPAISSSTFSSTGNSRATISCISQSVDGHYLYEITVPSSSGSAYYVGDKSKIPANMTPGSTTFTVDSEEMSNDPVLTISNNSVSEIRCGSTTYKATSS